MAADDLKERLDHMEHAFWDLVCVLADNLPENDPDDDDPETSAWVSDCRERFEYDKEEFDKAVKEIRQQVQV